MSKRKPTTPTRYPGVYSVDGHPNLYRVVGQAIDAKTGKTRYLDRELEAKSELAASKKRTELIAQLDVPKPAVERMRLGDYVESWLRSKLPKLKPSTRDLYTGLLDNHVLPVFGDYFVDAISADDIAKWRDELTGEPASVNSRLRVFKTVIRDAVEDLKLPGDPTRRVAALREATRDEDEDGKSITADQLRALVEAARVHAPKWYPFFYTLAFSGMRFGEATALKWSDIDEEAGRIRVRRAQWKGHVDTPKTKKSKRSLPLMPEHLAILQAHRETLRKATLKRLRRQKVPRIDAATQAANVEWVFPSRGGKHMHNTAPRKALALCLRKAKIDQDFTLHGFRHTFNNLVRQLTTDATVVRAMTGHTSVEMTDHYSSVALAERREVVGKLLHLVRGAAG